MRFLKKDIGITLCLFLLFLCITLPIYNRTSAIQDVGEYLNNPVRILHGEMPYRDFWLLMPPAEVILPAALYKIFGISIPMLLAVNSIVSALTGAVAFMVGRIAFARFSSAILFSLLFFFDSALYNYAGYNHSNWFLLFLMAAAYCLIRFINGRKDAFLVYAGAFAGLASCFRIYESAPFFIGTAATIILVPHMTIRNRLRHIVLFLASAAVMWGCIIALFFPAHYLVAIQEIFVNSVRHASASRGNAFGDIQGDVRGMLAHADSLWLISYYGNHLIRHSLNYLVIILSLIGGLSLLRKKDIEEQGIIIGLLIWTILSTGKMKEGIDSGILGFAIIPAFLIIMLWIESTDESKPKISLCMRILTIGLIGSSLYAVGGEWAAKINKNNHEIRSLAGTIYADDALYAKETNAVIQTIREITQPNEYIAVLHTMPYPFFAATERRNATYYDSLIDLLYRPSSAKEKIICDDILRKKAGLVVVEPSIIEKNSPLKTLRTCIEKSFSISSVYSNYLIYFPKDAYSL